MKSSQRAVTRPKRRRYDSSSRRETAAENRESILTAARTLFLARGYSGTTMMAIADASGLALDTIYSSVGKKPTLFRLLVETAISGRNEPVPAEERDYVRAIRQEPDPARKLRIYAAALRAIQPRLAPLFQVLHAAAPLDPDLQELWKEISGRRAANMLRLAGELAATGRLRKTLSVSQVADIIWSMNSPEFYLLLVEQRGWTSEDYGQWLGDAWVRLLLEA